MGPQASGGQKMDFQGWRAIILDSSVNYNAYKYGHLFV